MPWRRRIPAVNIPRHGHAAVLVDRIQVRPGIIRGLNNVHERTDPIKTLQVLQDAQLPGDSSSLIQISHLRAPVYAFLDDDRDLASLIKRGHRNSFTLVVADVLDHSIPRNEGHAPAVAARLVSR